MVLQRLQALQQKEECALTGTEAFHTHTHTFSLCLAKLTVLVNYGDLPNDSNHRERG